MAQVYEENLSWNMWIGIPKTIPEGQTFMPIELHDVGSVRFLMRRMGLPGTLTVSIRGTIDGLPSGDDLCVGTIDANTFVDAAPGEWYEIFLGEGTKVIAGGKYAIVFRNSGGNQTNLTLFACFYDNPYPGGTRVFTQRHATDWVKSDDACLAFQVLGPGCSGPLVALCEFLEQVGTFLINLSLDIAEFPLIGGPLSTPFELLGELFYVGADACCTASGKLKTLLDTVAEQGTAAALLALFLENWPTLYYLIVDPVDWFLVQLTLAFDLEPWHTQSLEFLAKWIVETYFPTLYHIWLDPEDWLSILLEDRFPILYYLVVDPKGEILYLIGQAFDLTPWEAQSAEFIVKALFERYFLTLYLLWLDPEDWLIEHVDPRVLAVPVAVAAFIDDPWGWLCSKLEDQIETHAVRIGEIAAEIIAQLLGV